MPIEDNWPGDGRKSKVTPAIGTLVFRKLHAEPERPQDSTAWLALPNYGRVLAMVVASEGGKGAGSHYYHGLYCFDTSRGGVADVLFAEISADNVGSPLG